MLQSYALKACEAQKCKMSVLRVEIRLLWLVRHSKRRAVGPVIMGQSAHLSALRLDGTLPRQIANAGQKAEGIFLEEDLVCNKHSRGYRTQLPHEREG